MNGSFDPITLLFLFLAVVIFLRLRNVLGRRSGHEQRPYEPLGGREGARGKPTDNVVPLPRSEDQMAGAQPERNSASAEQRIREFMPQTSPATHGLVQIAEVDPNFDPRQFVTGARAAYEMIVMAFAEGNKKMLKQLLTREVYDGFAAAITDREARGEVVDTNFIGIDKADIVDAELRNRGAQVTIKFVSQLITTIHSKGGELIEGDPKQIRSVTDIWTFAREISSRDPNWKLVATQSAN